MRWIDFDIKTMVTAFMPPKRRTPKFLQLVWWLTSGLASLKLEADAYRKDANARLPINGDRLPMQFLLCQLYGQGILVITRRRTRFFHWVGRRHEGEIFPWVPTRAEVENGTFQPLWVSRRHEARVEYDFDIILPIGNTTPFNKIVAIVEGIRYSGKTYRITRLALNPDEIEVYNPTAAL